MPATADAEIGSRAEMQRRPDRFRTWNRKLHYYLGLFLLLFLWLFSVSGLLLNHPKWATGDFWTDRRETVVQRPIQRPTVTGDIAVASALMRQLSVVGEVSDVQRAPGDTTFAFQVVKPGHVVRVAANFPAGRASVTEIELNAWGVMDALHKFTGVRMDRPKEQRDWLLTRLWSLAMDVLALGLVILVGSGVSLWWRLPQKRVGGGIALVTGVVCSGLFLYGFALIG